MTVVYEGFLAPIIIDTNLKEILYYMTILSAGALLMLSLERLFRAVPNITNRLISIFGLGASISMIVWFALTLTAEAPKT